MHSNDIVVGGHQNVNKSGVMQFARANPKRNLSDWLQPRFLQDAKLLGVPTISSTPTNVSDQFILASLDIEHTRQIWLSKNPTVEEVASISNVGLSVEFFNYAIIHSHKFQRQQMLPSAIDFSSSIVTEVTHANRKALGDYLNLEIPRMRDVSPVLVRQIDGISLAIQVMLDGDLYPHFCEGDNGATFNRVNVIAEILGGYDIPLITIAEIRFLRSTSQMLS